MVVEGRYPSVKDVAQLIRELSIEDRAEIIIQGVDVEWAINHSINTSTEVVAMFVDDRLSCMTGINVNDGLAPSVTPWLLGTTWMQSHPKQVLKYSRLILNRWKLKYPFMFNFVDARHTRAITWLKFLGAEFELLPEHGPYKKPFYRFTFGADPCALPL